ncbi:MAG: hypothetical protein V2I82_13160 [Halieaceae bacterium]|jgi:hypothetical protein|nr:hypothetical protein [Halieaceae bacterium]
MTDYASFNPTNVDEFVAALTDEVKVLGNKWWETNSSIVPGYLRSLAEATLQTEVALVEGKIDSSTADQVFRMQQAAFRQTMRFTKYMTLVLSQKVVDAVFRLVGWAIYNRVGFNFFPELVNIES